DRAPVEQDLTELLSVLGLIHERLVELVALDDPLCHEHRPQQGPVAAVLVHVHPPCCTPFRAAVTLESKDAPGSPGAKSLVQGFVTSSPSWREQVQTAQCWTTGSGSPSTACCTRLSVPPWLTTRTWPSGWRAAISAKARVTRAAWCSYVSPSQERPSIC